MAATTVQTLQPAGHHLRSIGEAHQAAACSVFVPPPQNVTVVYDDVPSVAHASEQKFIKSEDVIFVRSVAPVYGDVHSLFIVCDGHMGVGAANHCVSHMPGLLGQLLPQHLPDWTVNSEVEAYAEKVRRAISTAAVLLDNDWARLNDSSGTTLTMAVLSGWLLTVANTGDSNAIIDCGDDVQEITCSHRIQVNKAEQSRLREAGAQLAPVGFHLQGPAKPQEMGVGPLRMWPGGLCVSRSIGDLDAGPLIVPMPHVRQVVVNRHRALRIIMASDGLWDLMSFSKAAKSVRHKLPTAAVNALIQMAVRDRRMADDVSVIIADVLPPATPGATPAPFPASALKAGSPGSSGSSGGGGLFRCFKASPVENEGDDVIQPPQPSQPSPPPGRLSLDLRLPFAGGLARLSGRASGGLRRPGPPAKPWLGLQWFADVDCFEAYPMHKDQLARAEAPVVQRPKTPPKRGDYTVHGGQAHRFQQDSSWHTGNSHHGGSSELPLLLSQQQLEQLQADGPAAAASMHFSGNAGSSHHGQQQYQQQQYGGGSGGGLYASSSSSSGAHALHHQQQQQQVNGLPPGASSVPAAAAAAAAAGGGGGGVVPLIMGTHRSVVVSDSIPPRPSATAAAAGGGGSSSSSGNLRHALLAGGGPSRSHSSLQPTGSAATAPASPSPTALARSASAEFEHEGSAGVYVAADEACGKGLGAPGRMVKPAEAAGVNHYGSAPDAVVQHGREGRVHSGRGALAAAAAADDSDQQLRLGAGI